MFITPFFPFLNHNHFIAHTQKMLRKYKLYAQDGGSDKDKKCESVREGTEQAVKNRKKIAPATLFNEEILKTYSFASEYLSLRGNKSFLCWTMFLVGCMVKGTQMKGGCYATAWQNGDGSEVEKPKRSETIWSFCSMMPSSCFIN